METNAENSTNIVAARARYEEAKNLTDLAAALNLPMEEFLATERRDAQALVDTVSRWHEERAMRAMREASLILGTFGRVERSTPRAHETLGWSQAEWDSFKERETRSE